MAGPTIPQSLQPPQPRTQQKPLTVAQQRSIRLAPARRIQQQKDYQKAKNKLSNLSYENYFSEYAKLTPELKKYFTSPANIKSTEEFLKYQTQLKQYEQSQHALAAYNKEVSEWDIAKNYVRKKYSPRVVGGGIGKKMEELYEYSNARTDWLLKNPSVQLREKPSGTYIDSSGQGFSMAPDVAMDVLREEGGTYYGPEFKYEAETPVTSRLPSSPAYVTPSPFYVKPSPFGVPTDPTKFGSRAETRLPYKTEERKIWELGGEIKEAREQQVKDIYGKASDVYEEVAPHVKESAASVFSFVGGEIKKGSERREDIEKTTAGLIKTGAETLEPYVGPALTIGRIKIKEKTEDMGEKVSVGIGLMGAGVGAADPYVEEGFSIGGDILGRGFKKGQGILSTGIGLMRAGVEATDPYVEEGFSIGEGILSRRFEKQQKIVSTGLSIGSATGHYVEEGITFLKEHEPPLQDQVWRGDSSRADIFKRSGREITPPSGKKEFSSDLEDAWNKEWKLEQEAKGLRREFLKISEDDPEKQQKDIEKLEKKGVEFREVTDPKTGKTVLEIKYPEKFEGLRKGWERKTVREPFVNWATRKGVEKSEEAVTDISEFIIYKDTKLFAKQRDKDYRYNPSSVEIGIGVSKGMELAAYTVPYLGAAMFVGGTAETLIKRPKQFVQYTKEQPVDVALAASFGAVKGYQFYRSFQPTIMGTGKLLPSMKAKAFEGPLGKEGVSAGRQFSITSERRAAAGKKELFLGGKAELELLKRTKPKLYKKITKEMTRARGVYNPLTYLGRGKGAGYTKEQAEVLLKTKKLPQYIRGYERQPLKYKRKGTIEISEFGKREVIGTSSFQLTKPRVSTVRKYDFYRTQKDIPWGYRGIETRDLKQPITQIKELGDLPLGAKLRIEGGETFVGKKKVEETTGVQTILKDVRKAKEGEMISEIRILHKIRGRKPGEQKSYWEVQRVKAGREKILKKERYLDISGEPIFKETFAREVTPISRKGDPFYYHKDVGKIYTQKQLLGKEKIEGLGEPTIGRAHLERGERTYKLDKAGRKVILFKTKGKGTVQEIPEPITFTIKQERDPKKFFKSIFGKEKKVIKKERRTGYELSKKDRREILKLDKEDGLRITSEPSRPSYVSIGGEEVSRGKPSRQVSVFGDSTFTSTEIQPVIISPDISRVKAVTIKPQTFTTAQAKETRFSLGLLGEQKLELDTRTKLKDQLEIKTDLKSDSDFKIGLRTDPIFRTPSAVKAESITKPKSGTRLVTSPISKQSISQLTPARITGFPPRVPTEKPSIKPKAPGLIIPFFFPGETKFQKGQRTGYSAHVKDKGKYRQVTEGPYTRAGAKDVGARYTDSLLSATFKIEPIKQTKLIKGKKREVIRRFEEDELTRGDDYFKKTVHKFRNFMIKKGNKIQMQDKWIEKKQHRSDTKSEQQGLTLFQFKAREKKRRLGLPTRKKSSKKKGRKAPGFFRL